MLRQNLRQLSRMKRAIHIIPDLTRFPEIEVFRQRFDRLYPHIAAHITLVFPFDLPVSDDVIISHCRSCSSVIPPFSIRLQQPECSHDDHVWLPVSDSTPLRELTSRLYSGPLSPLIGTRRHSIFHVTVARPPLPRPMEHDRLQGAITFPVTIDVTTITLESIQPDKTSLILGRFHLQP